MSHQPKIVNNSNINKSNANSNPTRENLAQRNSSKKTISISLIIFNKFITNIDRNNLINEQDLENFDSNSATFFERKLSEDENVYSINNVFTFGSNEMGQIGCEFDGKDSNYFSPIPINLVGLNEKNIISIAAGDGHSVCVCKNGIVYAWGASACGKLIYIFTYI
jgi:alpha-tubulin suppressor-like RCC1 family protein